MTEETRHSELHPLGTVSYAELHQLAACLLRSGIGGGRETTSLLHEAYLRIARQLADRNHTREHVLALAARAMRCVLIDHARRAGAAKRGAAWQRIPLARGTTVELRADIDILALDEALNELARLDPRKARIVELRFFGGLSVEETAAVLGISPATVKRQWTMARAWLKSNLHDLSEHEGGKT